MIRYPPSNAWQGRCNTARPIARTWRGSARPWRGPPRTSARYTDLGEYHLVWEVTCEGCTWLTRGNGTDLPTFLKDPPEKRFGEIVCCPHFFGGRYAVVHWEPPTGLVRYRYWFFERCWVSAPFE